jgi:uncharacterized protein YqeY
MNTKNQIEQDLKSAIRANDELRKRTIRLALSAIRMAEIEKGSGLSEQEIFSVLQKEVKARRESIAEADQAGREDIATASEAEIEILNGYLPQPLSTQELETLAKEAIAETGASSVREMGQVMKILMPRVQGRAEGAQVSQIVRELLG